MNYLSSERIDRNFCEFEMLIPEWNSDNCEVE
jgi:hypothetical protein